jgi:predicted DNA-binding transcriptional regulator AlpA
MLHSELDNPVGRLLPAKMVAEDLGICRRTLARKVGSEPDFPRPVIINGRWYFRETLHESYKRRLIAGAL